jgi:ribosomal protein S18 acetylase RimI-like enzyme
MTLQIEPRHDLSPNEIDAIEDRIYDHNSYATGRHDRQDLGFVTHNEVGQMIGVAAGYTWSGTSELKQMWIDEAYRGRGYARALLNAFVAEACSRGVRRIWVASHNFQAPGMYEKAGFKRMAEFEGWPEGHMNVVKKSLFLLAVPRGQWKLCSIKRVTKFHGHNSTIEAQCVFSRFGNPYRCALSWVNVSCSSRTTKSRLFILVLSL